MRAQTLVAQAALSMLLGIVALGAESTARADEDASQSSDSTSMSRSMTARELVRIGAAGGAGYANEHAADDKGAYAAGVVSVSVFPHGGLSVALVGEMLSYYARNVPTTLPKPDGKGRLVLDVSERLPRTRQLVGYELLHHVLRDTDRARLAPYGFSELAWFVNGPVPQRAFSMGAGVATEVRVHEGLRLLADVSYASTLALDHPAVQRLFALGTLKGSFRMIAGAAFAIGRVARLELRYQGEMLYFAHSTRVLDTVLFGPVFHLR